MATLPIIDSAPLQTSTGRRGVNASPNSFGAQEAQGLGKVAQALDRASDVASSIDDDFNEANARDLDNELSRRIRDRLYNTESGYLSTQRGRNALDSRAQVEADIDAMAAELLPQARNNRAAAMYQDVARRRVTETLGSIAQHAARENTAYQNQVSESAIQEAIDNAVAAYDDPAQVAANRDTVLTELATLAKRNGWDDEILSQRVRQFQSDMSSRVIVQLAQSDPQAAQDYFERLAPSLTAQDRAELGTTMRAAIRQAEADLTDEAWVYVSNGQAIPADLWGRLPGRVRIDIQDYRRNRAEGGAIGDRTLIEDLRVMAVADPERFAQADLGAVRGALGANYDELAIAQARIRNGGAESSDVVQQRTTFNALRDIASTTLNIDLTPTEANRRRGNTGARADAFNAALLREVEAFTAANPGAAIDGQTAQILIGRAYVGMQGNLVTREQGRVQGSGPSRRRDATSEVVVPYNAIPSDIALRIGDRLQRRLGRTPTQGEVENAYARFVRSEEAFGGGE